MTPKERGEYQRARREQKRLVGSCAENGCWEETWEEIGVDGDGKTLRQQHYRCAVHRKVHTQQEIAREARKRALGVQVRAHR